MINERYLIKQAAQDRVEQLQSIGVRATVYKGHRDYVVQYEQPSTEKDKVS